jgi:hypothetical protein
MRTTKDYEARYFLLLHPGENDSCDHVSCVSGYFLRITEPTLTIGESATFEMMMYLTCLDQLAKIGQHALVIKKGEFLDI